MGPQAIAESVRAALRPSLRPRRRKPQRTELGHEIPPPAKGLPRVTGSLCPECRRIIEGRLFAEEGKVYMEKVCPVHGYFRDLYWSDVDLYLKAERWEFGDGSGFSNPAVRNASVCPEHCGLCQMHTSHTGLANVDLTNRCNLVCPVCFANASVSGKVYEPDFPTVRGMLSRLREQRPVPCVTVQFSGGEPTLHPHFFDILREAREMGFTHIQAATNGINFADLDYTREAAEAGLHTLYLQFDGVTDEVYRQTRGRDLVRLKFRVLDNVRAAGMKAVLVPTIIRGVNDHEVGAIVRAAIEYVDCVSAISFQPVAFTGRYSRDELEAKRYTLPDLARDVEEQTGFIAKRDWYPLSFVSPMSKLLTALRGQGMVDLTCHPHCSLGIYLFVGESGDKVPVTRFVDVEGMFQDLYKIARRTRSTHFKMFSRLTTLRAVKKYYRRSDAPSGLTFTEFLESLEGLLDKDLGRGRVCAQPKTRALLVAGMHFMDAYNYDVDRVRRCVIHYSTPDGKSYPFCTYNSGPCYRERVEDRFSVPLAEYRASRQGATQ